jgi:hypothetical protein
LRVSSLTLLFAISALPCERLAYAQSDADKENAQGLYKAGNDARDAGDMKMAAAKYKVAYALVQTPVIAVALGRAEMATGELIEARQTFLGVDRLPTKPHESALTTTARRDAATLAGQLEPRIPTVTLKITRPAGAPAPVVTMDGVAIPELALDTPRKVNPGPHTVVATNGTEKTEVPFSLSEGETREVPVGYPVSQAPVPVPVAVVAPVPLAPPVLVPPPLPPPAPPPPALPPPPPSSGPSHALAYTSLAVGGAGVVVTAVFGILALGDKSKLDGACGSDKSNCPSSDVSALSRDSLVSDVGLGFAIAGVGLGTVLLIVQRGGPSSDAPAAKPSAMEWTPWIGLGSLGMKGGF